VEWTEFALKKKRKKDAAGHCRTGHWRTTYDYLWRYFLL